MHGLTKCIWRSKTSLIGVVVVLSSLTLSLPTLGRDSKPVAPMGALAHAAASFETTTGGRVLEIRLADKTGTALFEAVVLMKDDTVRYMRVASPNDEVTEIAVEDLPRWLVNYNHSLEAYVRSAPKAEVPIDQAIVKAEDRAHAPAVDAGIAKPLDGANAVLAYFVETINGSRRDEFAVDAMTGQFIANPDSLYAQHTPVELARRLAALTP